MTRSRSTLRRRAALALIVGVASGAALAQPARGDGTPLPEVPPPLELTPADLEVLDRGEPLVRAVKVSDDERWAEAIYLFDAVPTEVFAVVTDPPTQQRLFREVELYETVERHPDGLSTHGIANVSAFIPNFEYWLRTRNDPLQRWNAWAQTRGDFDTNDGYWRFAYDPERGKTIGAMRLHFGLKGVLALVPEWIIVRLQQASMPRSLELVAAEIARIRAEEPQLHAERLARWDELVEEGVLADPLLRVKPASETAAIPTADGPG